MLINDKLYIRTYTVKEIVKYNKRGEEEKVKIKTNIDREGEVEREMGGVGGG